MRNTTIRDTNQVLELVDFKKYSLGKLGSVFSQNILGFERINRLTPLDKDEDLIYLAYNKERFVAIVRRRNDANYDQYSFFDNVTLIKPNLIDKEKYFQGIFRKLSGYTTYTDYYRVLLHPNFDILKYKMVESPIFCEWSCNTYKNIELLLYKNRVVAFCIEPDGLSEKSILTAQLNL